MTGDSVPARTVADRSAACCETAAPWPPKRRIAASALDVLLSEAGGVGPGSRTHLLEGSACLGPEASSVRCQKETDQPIQEDGQGFARRPDLPVRWPMPRVYACSAWVVGDAIGHEDVRHFRTRRCVGGVTRSTLLGADCESQLILKLVPYNDRRSLEALREALDFIR